MLSISIAVALIGQWKGFSPPAGQPAQPATQAISQPSIGYGDPPPPSALSAMPTSALRIRLASCQSRCAGLQVAIEQNASLYRQVARDPHCVVGRNRALGVPQAPPSGQMSRYLSKHKALKHQLGLVQTEIAAITAELAGRENS